jgi:hypothetical protein
LVPIRAICEHQYLFRREEESDQFHRPHLYKSTYVSNQTLPLLNFQVNALCQLP